MPKKKNGYLKTEMKTTITLYTSNNNRLKVTSEQRENKEGKTKCTIIIIGNQYHYYNL